MFEDLAMRLSVAEQNLDAEAKKGNRRAWEDAAMSGLCEQSIADVVAWYLSVSDTTGPVERGLGRLVETLKVHGHSDLAGEVSTLLEIQLDGPVEESAIARVERASLGDCSSSCRDDVKYECDRALRLTRFTRQCVQLWVATRGRRFGACSRAPGCRPTNEKKGTDVAAMRSQRRALNKLCATPLRPSETKTIVDGTLRSLQRGVSRMDVGTDRLANYKNLTSQKLQGQREQDARRANKQRVYELGPPRLGDLFSSGSANVPIQQSRRVCNASSVAELRVYPRHRCVAPRPDATTMDIWAIARQADVMVVDALSLRVGEPRAQQVAMCAAIMLGKRVATVVQYGQDLGRARCYKRALELKMELKLSTAFADMHPGWTALLRACAALSETRWVVQVHEDAQSCRITSLPALLQFMREVQRVHNQGFEWNLAT